MTDTTRNDLVKQSILELQDIVRCRCHPAYTGRGLHDPDCECDSAEAVNVVADRIEELEAENARLGQQCEGLMQAGMNNGQALILAEAERDALAEENERLIEALTPSGDTKAEYAGEFHISVYDAEDEDGNEIWRKVPVDWTTIKAIMAAIKARATIAELTGGKDE